MEESEKGSSIITIRHGQTDYTNQGLDLSEVGINQVKETAKQLKEDLKKYDRLIVISSPRARTLGTAKVFLETLGIPCQTIRTSKQARDVDVTDTTYQVWDTMRKSSDHGLNYWVEDSNFQEDFLGPDKKRLAEGRKSVNKRAERILRHYGNFVKKLEEKTGQKIALLLFTHWEIMLPYFLISQAEGPQHGEAVIINLDDPKNNSYTIYARGERSPVQYDKSSEKFIPRN